MTGYLAAFLVTVGVEPPLVAVGLRLLGDERSRARRWAVGLLVNATSHPLAWLVLWRSLAGVAAGPRLVAVEAFAVAWEAAWLRVWLGRDTVAVTALALVTNAVSLALGAAVR